MTEQLALPSEDAPASLLSGPMTVDSLRDSGYSDTERALAELIDNSYEAGARNVVVVIVQQRGKFAPGQKKASSRAVEMYVADDADGMDALGMNQALAFGSGTRLARKGIGRFGMGLPQASISQARRFDAWSWQESYGQALHTRVDLDAIAATNDMSVPWPREAGAPWTASTPANVYEPSPDEAGVEIPPFLLETGVLDEVLFGDGANHGTIIGWSKLDRTTWATASSIADHIAFFLGRTYRRFLEQKPVETRFDAADGYDVADLEHALDLTEVIDVNKAAALLRPAEDVDSGSRRLFVRVVNRRPSDDGATAEHERQTDFAAPGLDTKTGQILPNDPQYLLPADETHLGSWVDRHGDSRLDALFEQHDTSQVIFVQSRKQGDDAYYPVFITATHAKLDSRVTGAGHTDYGKNAKRNQGISVMRSDRELLLVDLLDSDDVRRRFVGLQLDFSPKLDEVFGVTNNKQDATQLSAALKAAKDYENKPLDELIADGRLVEGSPVAAIYPVARALTARWSSAFKVVKAQMEGTGSTGKNSTPASASPEVRNATEVDRTAKEEDLTEGEKTSIEESRNPGFVPPTEVEITEAITEAVAGATGADALYSDEDIQDIVVLLTTAGASYAFLNELNPENPAFFRVEERIGIPEARGRSKLIWLNVSHPIWENYLDDMRLSDEDLDDRGEAELRAVIRQARGVIVNMLIAWSRIELGGVPVDRSGAATSRERWGEQAKRYIKGNDDPSFSPKGSFEEFLG
jgi:hypothetical protein